MIILETDVARSMATPNLAAFDERVFESHAAARHNVD